ncbi:MAG TPA: TIGR02677 family protein [Actinomycetales bacterium]|nr:TIGR02677 family protein [Actinomycetales bacterium]
MSETTSSLRPFTHLAVEKTTAYRDVLDTFAAAKARFTVHLRPEDVADDMREPPADHELTLLLDQLVTWGNLRADPDTSRVTTVEDFHRARYLYSLTRDGDAVEAALVAYDAALGQRGELQAVALADIRDQLRGLDTLDPADDAKAHAGLILLTDRFAGLAANAQAFMSSVQRSVDLADADVEVFLAYKDRLVEYLQRFLRDLVVAGADIAAQLDALEPDVDALLLAAARREARDAAPGEDAGTESADESVALRVRQWRSRWAGLRHWFIGDRHHPSQSALLRDRARAAVPALLTAAAALHDRRSGRSDRSADFRRLALWFAQAPDDTSCHRIWRAAFGLAPARHLTVDVETLDAREQTMVPPSTPWSQAPPVVITPRLRRTGRIERRGKPASVTDRSAQRTHLAALAAAEHEQVEAARRRLATGRPTRLSELDELDPDSFGLFLSLLGDALSARVPGAATVETTTSDGSLAVRLSPTHDGRRAAVRTPGGVLRGPDHVLTVHDVTGDARRDDDLREGAAS